MPQSVKYLILITELKLLAQKLGIKRINISGVKCNIEFNESPNINTHTLIHLIQQESQTYQLKGSNCLIFNIKNNDSEPKIHEVQKVLISLQVN